MSTLTTQQQATIIADIQAQPDLNVIPAGSDGDFAIAALYNAPASPTFWVLSTAASSIGIFNAITFANYTPNDAVPTPGATATLNDVCNQLVWQNRCLAAQTKQFNLSAMLGSRTTIDATKTTLTAGLQDALQHLPTGANGINKDAGWAAVEASLARQASRIEKLLANTAGGNGSTSLLPALAPFGDGYTISPNDIATIRGANG